MTNTGLEQLQDKADNLAALLQEWYNTHSNDIANQLAQALEDFAIEANRLAQESIETIPADYSEFYADFEQLKKTVSTYENIIMNLPNVLNINLLDKEIVEVNSYYQNTSGELTIHDPVSGANTKRMIAPIRLLAGHTYDCHALYNGFSFICERDSKTIITGLSAGILPYTPSVDCDLYVTLDNSTLQGAYVSEIFTDGVFNTDKTLTEENMPADAKISGDLFFNHLQFLTEQNIPTQANNTDTIISGFNFDSKRKYLILVTNNGPSAGYVRFAIVDGGQEEVALGNILVNGLATEEMIPSRTVAGNVAYSTTNQLSVRNINGIAFTVKVYIYTDSDYGHPMGLNKVLFVNGNEDRLNYEFSNVPDAVRYALNTYAGTDRVDIYIKDGTYDVIANQSYEPYTAINIAKTYDIYPTINLHGQSRENTIIQMRCVNSMQGRVIDMGGENQIVENLTIRNTKDYTTLDSNKRPYAIHNDAGHDPDQPYRTTMRNCIIYSECMSPIGAGLRHNQEQIYENCIFIYNGNIDSSGVFYVHGPSRTGDTPIGVTADTCTFISKNPGSPVIDMGSVPDMMPYTEIPVTFRRCIAVSTGNNIVPTNFQTTHMLTIDSQLNNNQYLNK